MSDQLDRAFKSLGHPYRRRILLAVRGTPHSVGEDVSLPELLRGNSIEARRGDAGLQWPADDVSTHSVETEDPESLWTELYHVHLPKLEQAGYVESDPDRRRVRPGPNFDEIEPLLDLLVEHWDELPGKCR
jgi:DNA-binding transcriptional ArsR family regulator